MMLSIRHIFNCAKEYVSTRFLFSDNGRSYERYEDRAIVLSLKNIRKQTNYRSWRNNLQVCFDKQTKVANSSGRIICLCPAKVRSTDELGPVV